MNEDDDEATKETLVQQPEYEETIDAKFALMAFLPNEISAQDPAVNCQVRLVV